MPRAVPGLAARAGAMGVSASYTDIAGHRKRVGRETLAAVLDALDGELAPSPRRLLAPVVASFEPAPVRVRFRDSGPVRWTLAGEDGGRRAGEARGLLELPGLPPGYYRLTAQRGAVSEGALVVRAPERAWMPAALKHARGFGLAVQLYELLGPLSLGIGDFSDLAGLAREAGGLGADALGLNPLHALYLSNPEHASPYSPNSRLALNPLYLDVRRLPGLEGATRRRLDEPAFRARVAALNAQSHIDYAGASEVKLALAREAWRRFRDSGGSREFDRFRHAAPPALGTWADFEVIAAEHGSDAARWPAQLADPAGGGVRCFVDARAESRDFHLWLQWQADVQLAEAAGQARAAGMGIGLYHDLALGADPGGAEVWAARRDYVAGLAVGAPPDPLNPRGQNWGFPPLHPLRLAESGLRAFIELIRANMRHAGALRIDHVLGLNRLFVIPRGARAAEGTYLRYPLDALLAALTLESHRARCLVIGEDLGTVPRGLRTRLARRGIFSLRLLYFEREAGGRPRRPDRYPRNALAAVGSHDLPPLAGWWRGSDLERMDRLTLWPDAASREAANATRPVERALFAAAFTGGKPRERQSPGAPPAAAAYAWLARSRSRLLMIQPEDALGVEAPVNVPGTVREEPNWRRRRLPSWPRWLADPRFSEVLRAVQAERLHRAPQVRPPPVATYRMQLHAEFGFADAARQGGYLARLGVSHLYASPVLAAVPGSLHGYDMVDPAWLDPGRGGDAGFVHLRQALHREGMELIADFVPNHMGAHPANPWWMDLLEWGRASAYAGSFDIDWQMGAGRIVLPILGEPLADAVDRGDVGLELTPGGRFRVTYFEHRIPLAPSTTAPIVAAAARGAPAHADALAGVAGGLRRLTRVASAGRRARGLELQARLADLARDGAVRRMLEQHARALAARPDRLRRLLERQPWRLAYWRPGLEEVNYRRFFDIASLAALRLERPEVFAAAHERIRSLAGSDGIAGLRLDHIDGLAAPTRYLETLAGLLAAHRAGTSLWVEKILGATEALPAWPVAGATGYEFLNDVTRLLLPAAGERELRGLWQDVDPEARPFADTLAAAKREAVTELLAPMLARVAQSLAHRAPVPAECLQAAVAEAVVALPVYRAYPDAPHGSRGRQRELVATAERAARGVDPAAGQWLGRVLAIPLTGRARLPARLRDGAARFWQLAAAAMAKGLEDTAFYRDFAVLARNEVGGDPDAPLLDAVGFHGRMRDRAARWPHALNAGATHDTKRGEDARMRLAMLAARASEWCALVPRLTAAAAGARPAGLHPADEYLAWQTLLAVWPPPCRELNANERTRLADRVAAYLVKATREGKQRSSWLAPDESYEARLTDYAAALAAGASGADWRRLFLPFAARLAATGALASLSALTLRLTAPGVPDIYQGNELWDLALVDPDNRRPVDYALRARLLQVMEREVPAGGALPPSYLQALVDGWPDGRIKFFLLRRLLALRAARPGVFAEGAYAGVRVYGDGAGRVVAFRRGSGRRAVAVVVARPGPDLQAGAERCALAAAAWCDEAVALRGRWHEELTGREFAGPRIPVAELLAPLPVAVLTVR